MDMDMIVKLFIIVWLIGVWASVTVIGRKKGKTITEKTFDLFGAVVGISGVSFITFFVVLKVLY